MSNRAAILTHRQRAALKWLREYGEGLFGKGGVVVARGDWRYFLRSTWDGLRDTGMVGYDGDRVVVTPLGRQLP